MSIGHLMYSAQPDIFYLIWKVIEAVSDILVDIFGMTLSLHLVSVMSYIFLLPSSWSFPVHAKLSLDSSFLILNTKCPALGLCICDLRQTSSISQLPRDSNQCQYYTVTAMVLPLLLSLPVSSSTAPFAVYLDSSSFLLLNMPSTVSVCLQASFIPQTLTP